MKVLGNKIRCRFAALLLTAAAFADYGIFFNQERFITHAIVLAALFTCGAVSTALLARRDKVTGSAE